MRCEVPGRFQLLAGMSLPAAGSVRRALCRSTSEQVAAARAACPARCLLARARLLLQGSVPAHLCAWRVYKALEAAPHTTSISRAGGHFRTNCPELGAMQHKLREHRQSVVQKNVNGRSVSAEALAPLKDGSERAIEGARTVPQKWRHCCTSNRDTSSLRGALRCKKNCRNGALQGELAASGLTCAAPATT
jgi:hypothetical protein